MSFTHTTINSDMTWEIANGLFTYPHTRLRNTFVEDYRNPSIIPINLGHMVAKLGGPTEITMPLGKHNFDNFQLGILLVQIYRMSSNKGPDGDPSLTAEHLFYNCDEQSPDLELVAMAILGKISDSRVFPGGSAVTDRIRRLYLAFIAWVCSRSVVLARMKNRYVDYMGRFNVLAKPIFSLRWCFMQEYYRSLVRWVISNNRASNSIGWIEPDQFNKCLEELSVRKVEIMFF